jgi:hypothetical protein
MVQGDKFFDPDRKGRVTMKMERSVFTTDSAKARQQVQRTQVPRFFYILSFDAHPHTRSFKCINS